MRMVMTAVLALMVMIVAFHIANMNMFVRMDMSVFMAVNFLRAVVVLVGVVVLMFV
jgi:hypothetical protein